jgi:hypothetical protein
MNKNTLLVVGIALIGFILTAHANSVCGPVLL